ncbi:MAG: ATP-binding cassette domain-containing protein [Actinomycetota bacterium]
MAGIDFQIPAGQIFGFLGPNGAGKTTTVRILTTLLKPTGGRAMVAGHDVVAEPDAVRRAIGVALQDASIDPLMTGRELVRLQATLHGIEKSKGIDRGESLLQTVGLAAAADRRVGTYSGGMRRRLDLALALIHEPEVLFLDEPTTGLDPNSRVTLWEELRYLNREGTTVFLTTQYMEEADQLAGRIAIIDNGRIVAEGSPAQLKAKVGEPTLRVALAGDANRARAEQTLAEFGETVPAADGYIAIRLSGGASRMASVSRALDDSRIAIEGLELHTPTLDDVFHIATGRHLEGDEPSVKEPQVP